MKKLTDYTDRCGSCAKFSRLIKDGKVQERGRCVLRGKYTYHQSSQKCCLKYEGNDKQE